MEQVREKEKIDLQVHKEMELLQILRVKRKKEGVEVVVQTPMGLLVGPLLDEM